MTSPTDGFPADKLTCTSEVRANVAVLQVFSSRSPKLSEFEALRKGRVTSSYVHAPCTGAALPMGTSGGRQKDGGRDLSQGTLPEAPSSTRARTRMLRLT